MTLRGHESEKEHVDLPETQQIFMNEIMNCFQGVILDMERKFEKKMEDQHIQTEGSIREAFRRTESNFRELMGRLQPIGGQNQMLMPDQQQQLPREMIPAQGGANVAMDDVEAPPPPLGVDNVLERQDPVLPIKEVADNVNEVNQAEIGVYVPPHVRGKWPPRDSQRP
ncbi:ral guanine nucleotide dissociation stimulator-like isoform 2 [Corchorus olitorius]|uniref:Ral guanine nucleotide dissociation stimulator-like isoform 2 n=1 Tax=Corchorus olitorius TaxID=93759 RepID=A0A1R3KI02_9ROSI|nr:ral guanine nucleotide dissociation stimulator-like isoform 2 [Corchorus olitorius]